MRLLCRGASCVTCRVKLCLRGTLGSPFATDKREPGKGSTGVWGGRPPCTREHKRAGGCRTLPTRASRDPIRALPTRPGGSFVHLRHALAQEESDCSGRPRADADVRCRSRLRLSRGLLPTDRRSLLDHRLGPAGARAGRRGARLDRPTRARDRTTELVSGSWSALVARWIGVGLGRSRRRGSHAC